MKHPHLPIAAYLLLHIEAIQVQMRYHALPSPSKKVCPPQWGQNMSTSVTKALLFLYLFPIGHQQAAFGNTGTSPTLERSAISG